MYANLAAALETHKGFTARAGRCARMGGARRRSGRGASFALNDVSGSKRPRRTYFAVGKMSNSNNHSWKIQEQRVVDGILTGGAEFDGGVHVQEENNRRCVLYRFLQACWKRCCSGEVGANVSSGKTLVCF